MSLKTIVIASLAAVAAANPMAADFAEDTATSVQARSSPSYSACPVTHCTINVRGTYWNEAYLRRNPCNNQSPIKTLYQGATVYDMGVKPKYGCGYNYVQVIVPGSNGRNTVGWVSSQFLKCDSYPYPPAPAPAVSAEGAKSSDA